MARKNVVAHRKAQEEAPKKENYFQKIFGMYINSFKSIDSQYFYYIFYDLLFLVFAGGLVFLMGYLVKNYSGLAAIAAIMQDPNMASQLQYLEQLKRSLIYTVLMFLLLVVILIIAWSYARAFIYDKIYNRKFEWKASLKFTASNLVIMIAFLALLSSIPVIVVQDKMPILASIAILAMLYFTTIFYITFFRVGLFVKALSETLNTAVVKVHRLIIPFVLLIITLLFAIGVFSFITQWLSGANESFLKLVFNMLTIVFLLFLWSWARLYLVKVVNYVARKE
jgi:hypothetical protein